MRCVILLSVLTVALAFTTQEEFLKHYIGVNMDDILNNERLLKANVLCVVGEGRCTNDGLEFKKFLPGLVKSNCADCSEAQKVQVAKMIKTVQTKFPKEWDKLYLQNDPKKEREPELKDFLNQYYKP